ncbi:hypothetical protein I3F58_22355 [Streptomyces sp. MUM 203J]|uniref:hypothetical protein n=1 Tax=Streptomyces sp. MUM 203J TaxID=2791990 RepID=UPI001F03A831|nr:hypothetical protein [Streptomyces sp. MUM 203J]MCH0542242.1 hypothetical protein [Streptomyces sp. MUM 203J]
MAAPHRLGTPPSEPSALAAWALSRLAATAAEDVRADAVVEYTRAPRAADARLGGRYGTWTPGGGKPEETFRLRGLSSRDLRTEDGDEPWAVLFDPARLIRAVGGVTDARRTPEEVEATLTPTPWFAAPTDPWLPPAAHSLTVRIDPATGFLLRATLSDDQGELATARVPALSLKEPPATTASSAATTLARMARTLLEPTALTAGVRIQAETHEDLDYTAVPSPRTWTVSTGAATLTMSGAYEPDRTGPRAARLAELLTPARIVAHLADVRATSPTSIRSTVRPLRTFPFSAWAPDEDVTCHFRVDPATGVLLEAKATSTDHTLFHHVVTSFTRR